MSRKNMVLVFVADQLVFSTRLHFQQLKTVSKSECDTPPLFNWLSAKTACDVQVVSDSAKKHVGIFVQDSQALTLHA